MYLTVFKWADALVEDRESDQLDRELKAIQGRKMSYVSPNASTRQERKEHQGNAIQVRCCVVWSSGRRSAHRDVG